MIRKDGILLVAHGARDANWSRPFEVVAQRLCALNPSLTVQLAFLEFMEPDIDRGAATLAAATCTHVQLVPMFLGASGHVQRDLPPRIHILKQRFPGVEWRLHAALGETETVIHAMTMAALETLR